MRLTEAGRNRNQTVTIELGYSRPSKITVGIAVLLANNGFGYVIDNVFVCRFFNKELIVINFNLFSPPYAEIGVESLGQIDGDGVNLACIQKHVRHIVFIDDGNGIALCILYRNKLCTVGDLELHNTVARSTAQGTLNVQFEAYLAIFACVAEGKLCVIGTHIFGFCIAICVVELNAINATGNFLEGYRFRFVAQNIGDFLIHIFIISCFVKYREIEACVTVLGAELERKLLSYIRLIIRLFQNKSVLFDFVMSGVYFSLVVFQPNTGGAVKINGDFGNVLIGECQSIKNADAMLESNNIFNTNREFMSCRIGGIVIHNIGSLFACKGHRSARLFANCQLVANAIGKCNTCGEVLGCGSLLIVEVNYLTVVGFSVNGNVYRVGIYPNINLRFGCVPLASQRIFACGSEVIGALDCNIGSLGNRKLLCDICLHSRLGNTLFRSVVQYEIGCTTLLRVLGNDSTVIVATHEKNNTYNNGNQQKRGTNACKQSCTLIGNQLFCKSQNLLKHLF